jgi:hypothetical protein
MPDLYLFGVSGITRPCLIALDMVLSGPLAPQQATIVTTNNRDHLFILWDCGQPAEWPFQGFIIPTGFASGYGGEGARGFSLALCMLQEHGIPLSHINVDRTLFTEIDSGNISDELQVRIREASVPLDMPVPNWVFAQHWELAQSHRLWRVQYWRGLGIEWSLDADTVNDFSWNTGDKLYWSSIEIGKNTSPMSCQRSALHLRDAWYEFNKEIRRLNPQLAKESGKDHVDATVDALVSDAGLDSAVGTQAKKSLSKAKSLQHDRGANVEETSSLFTNTVAAMAGIIRQCYPTQKDRGNENLIRPN